MENSETLGEISSVSECALDVFALAQEFSCGNTKPPNYNLLFICYSNLLSDNSCI